MKKKSSLVKSILFSLFILVPFVLSSCAGGGDPNLGPNLEVVIDPSLGTTEAEAPTQVATEPAEEVDGGGETEAVQPETSSPEGYPYPAPGMEANPADYPAPEQNPNVSSEPPNPERNIELLDQATGSMGGVLVQELDSGGFQPVKPVDLFLAEQLLDNNGNPVFIGKSENSPAAQLFDTGVFIFQGIVPDSYGLIIDLGFTQLPINDENGTIRIFDVKPGEAIDLGSVIVELP